MEFLAGLPTVSADILVLVFLLIVFQEAVTVGKIALTWVTTLPGTVIVSFVLSLIFYVALV